MSTQPMKNQPATDKPKINLLKRAEINLRIYMIATVLSKNCGSLIKTADELGITQGFLRYNIHKFSIDIETIKAEARLASQKKPVIPEVPPLLKRFGAEA